VGLGVGLGVGFGVAFGTAAGVGIAISDFSGPGAGGGTSGVEIGVGCGSIALSGTGVATEASALAGAPELSSVIVLVPPNDPGLSQTSCSCWF
jgi:hypothetical protein